MDGERKEGDQQGKDAEVKEGRKDVRKEGGNTRTNKKRRANSFSSEKGQK